MLLAIYNLSIANILTINFILFTIYYLLFSLCDLCATFVSSVVKSFFTTDLPAGRQIARRRHGVHRVYLPLELCQVLRTLTGFSHY